MHGDEFLRKHTFKRNIWEQNNQHLKPTSLTESLYMENMNEKELTDINVTVLPNRLKMDKFQPDTHLKLITELI